MGRLYATKALTGILITAKIGGPLIYTSLKGFMDSGNLIALEMRFLIENLTGYVAYGFLIGVSVSPGAKI